MATADILRCWKYIRSTRFVGTDQSGVSIQYYHRRHYQQQLTGPWRCHVTKLTHHTWRVPLTQFASIQFSYRVSPSRRRAFSGDAAQSLNVVALRVRRLWSRRRPCWSGWGRFHVASSSTVSFVVQIPADRWRGMCHLVEFEPMLRPATDCPDGLPCPFRCHLHRSTKIKRI